MLKTTLHLLRRFHADQRGLALVFVSIMLPVLVGFSVLAVDMARVNNLHYDLQEAADAFALAAAAELDGNLDALIRANRAIDNLLDNQSRFSTTGLHTIERADLVVTFLKSIPASDATALDDEGLDGNGVNRATTLASEARYSEVTVSPTAFETVFPIAMLGGPETFSVGGQAVAGFSGTVACDMTPLFICNPFPNLDLTDVVSTVALYRKSIKLVAGSNTWGPGNFGFLRPQDAHGYGESQLAADIAGDNAPECVRSNSVYTQTGALSNKARDAFNVRFDMYANGGGFPSKSDASNAPAPNIRKGYEYVSKGKNANACNMQEATNLNQYRRLTRDTAFPGASGRVGNGLWDYEGYLFANNFSVTDMSGFRDASGNAYSNANPPSRYDLYMYEINHNNGQLMAKASKGGEIGTPACHAAAAGSLNPKRRLVYAALVDCATYAGQLNGQSGTIPAMGYGSFFLTEPATSSEIYAEIVDINGVEGRGTMINFARDEVQLYR